MNWLLGKAGEWVLFIGGAIALLAGVWFGGKRSGKAAEQAKQDRQRAEAITAKMESDREIDDLAPADLDKRFSRWLRRGEPR